MISDTYLSLFKRAHIAHLYFATRCECTHSTTSPPTRVKCRSANNGYEWFVVGIYKRNKSCPHRNTARVIAGAVDGVNNPSEWGERSTCRTKFFTKNCVWFAVAHNFVGNEAFCGAVEFCYLSFIFFPVNRKITPVKRRQRMCICQVCKVQGEIEFGCNIDVFAHEGKLLRKSAGRFSINAESPSCASGPRKFNIS